MSPQRADAYRRVLRTLADLGPTKLQADEQERVRAAADTLLFSAEIEGDEARAAVDDIETLRGALVDSGRWEGVTAGRLAADIRACGPPEPAAALSPA